MLINKLAVGFKIVAITATFGLIQAYAANQFRIEKNSQGLILPFKAVSAQLPDFVREYTRITAKPIASGGVMAEDLKGSVTLFLRRPFKVDDLTEIFHRVLNDNGYSVVDAPAGNGWIIVRTREARDLALPVYEIGNVPNTARLVTAFHDLKFANAEFVARIMRSFMPANSRIIPSTRSQLFITDTGSNIRKLNWIISKMDTKETAKKQRELASSFSWGPPRSCGEQRIEKLVVESLEIQEPNSSQIKPLIKGGARK